MLVETATSGEILSLADAKRYLRIPDSVNDEDAEIQGMLIAARMDAERFTRRTLRLSVTREDVRRGWFDCYEFKYPPLHTTPAITVKYYDSDNSLQTVSSSDYFVYPDVSTGEDVEGTSRLEFDTNFTHPILYDRRPDPILLTYTTGYVSDSRIPKIAREAVKLLLWELYYKDTKNDAFGVNVGLGRQRAYELLGSISFGFYA